MEREESLDSPLISINEEKGYNLSTKGLNILINKDEIFEEVKKQLYLAAPLMTVNLLVYSLQVISVMFVGHLGALALSGASMATSFASVTGFSLMVNTSLLYLTFHFSLFTLKSKLSYFV